ncbi:MAG: hypothetical protein LBK29_02550 [Oscillospiraceae bacterium]|jgi:hypothetical protein|nr:hypothetical protein [Oscillospiraceae bacterium]
MNKTQAIIYYKTSMAIFKKWLSDGIINQKELTQIDTVLSEKYGLSSTSIYR